VGCRVSNTFNVNTHGSFDTSLTVAPSSSSSNAYRLYPPSSDYTPICPHQSTSVHLSDGSSPSWLYWGSGSQPAPTYVSFNTFRDKTSFYIKFRYNFPDNAYSWSSNVLITTNCAWTSLSLAHSTPTHWNNILYGSHWDTSVGIQLPAFYVNTYYSACPVTAVEFSRTSGSMNTETALKHEGSYKVKPVNPYMHGQWTFYIRVTTRSNVRIWIPQAHILSIGCHSGSLSFTNSASFLYEGVFKWVGSSRYSVYTFYPPTLTANRPFCSIEKNEVVTTNGYTAHPKINNCNSQPCTVYDLVDTIYPEVIYFKIRTTATNNQVHISPTISTTLECNNNYPIYQRTTPTNPQIYTHDSSAVGYLTSWYTSSQQTGCPVDTWELSTSGSSFNLHTQLQRTGSNPNFSVKPTNNALHRDYTFYLRVRAKTGRNGQSTDFFGPFYLYIGCTVGSESFTDHNSLIVTAHQWVGSTPASIWTHYQPYTIRSWCWTQNNYIMYTDGTTWTGTAEILPTGSQPHTVYDLVTTAYE